jgi:8-oxo-dGTP pyrophosphatase MutT (NUDIX family)
MEYRDLYDENKNLTGEKILKGDDVPKGRYYITVAVFIENSNNEFLLQINKKYNMWTTTGGHPKSGESSLEGIVIEVKEELGLDVEPERFELFKTIKTEDDFVDLYYLKGDFDLSKIQMQEEEVGNVGWFSKEDIEKLINDNKFLPPHIEFYRDCLNYLDK